ncbi:22302_t:CDS:2 [Rhizophagus irregularis]|nr:22302_t:CDS:2 [Rhizophagus irregularis]
MEVFKVKKKKNEKELRNELYYNAFYKFICVLEEIEKFTENVSRIRGLEKYVKTTYIKENFITLSDLGEFDKFLEAVGGTFYEELIKKHIDTKTFQTNKIDSRDLILPVQGKPNDTRGKYPNVVMRRILNGQEVACKSNSTTEEDTKVQRQLEILTKISECKHILRFYGVSKIDDINIWVFEWAHRGTLKELYETKDIQWHYKAQIALNICHFVIKGGREIIKFGDSTPEISKLQEDYKRIISGAWKQDPQERISFLEALDMLDGLNDSLRHTFVSALIDKNASDLDGSKASDDDLVLSALDEGILAYRAGDHQKAWNYFEYHAANENIVAKFWKGHYLWEGLHDGIKEREEGRELLKEAADKGNSDAQLCYAFTFNKVLSEDDNINTFIDYLTKAAEGNNDIAQYNLGDIYYKGKLNIPKDENRGIKWLRKAALQNNNNAIKLLEASGIVIIE